MNAIDTTLLDSSLTEAWSDPEKLPAPREWLAAPRPESAQAQYAFIILKKHFARAGVGVKWNEVPTDFWRFDWLLYLNLDELVGRREHSAMLRDFLAEAVDFRELAGGEYFVQNLFGMLEKFIEGDPPYSLIVPLLPAKALAKMEAMREILWANREEERRRMDQMGY
jgi:hypothetical protein